MSIGSILSWIVCGLIVGAVARLITPGQQSMSVTMTMVIGIVGALLGGFLYSLFGGSSVRPFTLASENWYGWIIAILGAVLLVWFYPRRFRSQWSA